MESGTHDRPPLARRRRARPARPRLPRPARGSLARGTWPEAAERVENIANGLLARGVGKGDAFATFARTTLEWVLLDFALAQIGAVGAPVYANSSPRDAAYVLDHSESIGVLCEDAELAARVESERASLPRLRHLLTYDDLPGLEAEGSVFKAEHPTALDDAMAAVGEEDLFTFIYTSGTTGPPKGCMISHRNYYAMVAVIDHLPEYVMGEDLMLLYLPLAHNFGRLMHLSGPYVGYAIAFLPDPLADGGRGRHGPPDGAPERAPRVREDPHRRRRRARRDDGRQAPDRKLVARRRTRGERAPVARRAGRACARGKRKVADRLVFAKIRDRLGGRLRTPISGGAPLVRRSPSSSTRSGSGSTRATASPSARPRRRRTRPRTGVSARSAGRCPGFELRIAEDGELMIRSETVFGGYYKDPEATAAVLEPDGWLHSGDIAEIDAGRVRQDHRPQEGHHRHGRRQEHRAAEPGERPEGVEVRLAGARRRRPQAVSGRADHARRGRDRQVGGGAGPRRRTWRRWRATSASSRSCRGSSTTSTASALASSRSSASRSSRATSRWRTTR